MKLNFLFIQKTFKVGRDSRAVYENSFKIVIVAKVCLDHCRKLPIGFGYCSWANNLQDLKPIGNFLQRS